jgi:hypothetical protein
LLSAYPILTGCLCLKSVRKLGADDERRRRSEGKKESCLIGIEEKEWGKEGLS